MRAYFDMFFRHHTDIHADVFAFAHTLIFWWFRAFVLRWLRLVICLPDVDAFVRFIRRDAHCRCLRDAYASIAFACAPTMSFRCCLRLCACLLLIISLRHFAMLIDARYACPPPCAPFDTCSFLRLLRRAIMLAICHARYAIFPRLIISYAIYSAFTMPTIYTFITLCLMRLIRYCICSFIFLLFWWARCYARWYCYGLFIISRLRAIRRAYDAAAPRTALFSCLIFCTTSVCFMRHYVRVYSRDADFALFRYGVVRYVAAMRRRPLCACAALFPRLYSLCRASCVVYENAAIIAVDMPRYERRAMRYADMSKRWRIRCLIFRYSMPPAVSVRRLRRAPLFRAYRVDDFWYYWFLLHIPSIIHIVADVHIFSLFIIFTFPFFAFVTPAFIIFACCHYADTTPLLAAMRPAIFSSPWFTLYIHAYLPPLLWYYFRCLRHYT